jgi:hypothetical protein
LRGWPHALLNCAGFVLVARPVERRCGVWTACAVFVASATAAFGAGVFGHGPVWLAAGGSGAVLGFAGFIAARPGQFATGDRVAVVVVLAVTFLPPVLLPLVGVSPPGSLPAHAGGLMAGVVLGCAAEFWVPAAVVIVSASVVVLAVVAPSHRPRKADVVACAAGLRSSPAHIGARTRVMFVNRTDRDAFVYWINYQGLVEYGATVRHTTSFGRDRLPFYGHDGAVYAVVDAAGSCTQVAVAHIAPETVAIRKAAVPSNCRVSSGRPISC